MLLLFLSLVALAAGPLAIGRLRERAGLASAVDGFVVTAIPLLVLLPLVPHAIEEHETLLLIVIGAGFAVPILLARLSKTADRGVHGLGLLFGTIGLALHALIDGSALGVANQLGGWGLAPAVVLHRLPVGLAIWWLVERNFGRRAAVAAIAILMGATVAGFMAGSAAARLASWHEWLHLFQAAVAGSLVHVAYHRHGPGHDRTEPRFEALGAVAAAILVLFALVPANGGETAAAQEFLAKLVALAAVSAPALLVGLLAAGLLPASVAGGEASSFGQGGQIALDGRGLVVAGVLSIPLLGWPITLLWLGAVAGIGVLAAWFTRGPLEVDRVGAAESEAMRSAPSSKGGAPSALRTRTTVVVDHNVPWILVGLLVATLGALWLEGGWLSPLTPVVGVVLVAAIGLPAYVRAASAMPVVAVLLAAGFTPGAGVAFMIAGCLTSMSRLDDVAHRHSSTAALRLAGTLFILAISAGILADVMLPALPVPTLAQLTEGVPTSLQWISLASLAALLLGTVFRQGVRRL